MLENIKRLCAKRGIRINDLEAAVGLGKNTIYKWSACSPSVANIKLVADYLGCSIDELVCDMDAD